MCIRDSYHHHHHRYILKWPKQQRHREDHCKVRVTNKKRLKNVGPIRHNEPPHANSPDVASGTVARRLRIDVDDNANNDDNNDNA